MFNWIITLKFPTGYALSAGVSQTRIIKHVINKYVQKSSSEWNITNYLGLMIGNFE